MPLPDYQRVIYAKNPLEEVICQLRFPPILRIETEIPAAFQERLRESYPLYQEQTIKIDGASLPAELVRILPAGLSSMHAGRVHAFGSSDERWKIALTKDAISLTAASYQRWEEFCERLKHVTKVFEEFYHPSFYSRVGLRYQDVIRRKRLGLDETRWAELLAPQVAGELASDDVFSEIAGTMRQLTINLPNSRGKVLVKHGIGHDTESKEECYLIDCDYFQEQRTETKDATELLDFFNTQAGRFFRWCITDRLHRAMEPNRL